MKRSRTEDLEELAQDVLSDPYLVLRKHPFHIKGSLTRILELDLEESEIDDKAMKALSAAILSGALANCRSLNLAWNKISDSGMVSFSDAIARGAMGKLQV